MDDLTLAQRIHERDAEALDLLVERHHSALFRFLGQLTRDHDDAEDLTQQSLMRAIVGAHRFDGRASFRAWLLGIAFHEFTRYRRRRVWLPILAEFASRSRAIEAVDEAEALRTALAKLKPESRAIFLMHHVEELSVREISAALRVAEGTVKSRLHAAREQLRTYLGEGERTYVPETC
ncbi:MAG: RNA polymerase sigma factor [Armatimonadetes bacterium]|nr:RNA polymerase sigma factor [Armatimonadota bacterium]